MNDIQNLFIQSSIYKNIIYIYVYIYWKKSLTWSLFPPEVALEIAHAASFWMSNSAVDNSWMSLGNTLFCMISWIWSEVPAVMLEMVQHASLRMFFFWWSRRPRRWGTTLRLRMYWVCSSVPVTMFPTVRSAGVWTEVLEAERSSTSLESINKFIN